MLAMPASQIGYPVAILVQMVSDNLLFHDSLVQSGVKASPKELPHSTQRLQLLEQSFSTFPNRNKRPIARAIDIERSEKRYRSVQ